MPLLHLIGMRLCSDITLQSLCKLGLEIILSVDVLLVHSMDMGMNGQ